VHIEHFELHGEQRPTSVFSYVPFGQEVKHVESSKKNPSLHEIHSFVEGPEQESQVELLILQDLHVLDELSG
jgi:hypothetical protein